MRTELGVVVDLPGQLARTRRFQAGAPSNHSIVGDGRFVVYLRDDAVWVYDVSLRLERRLGAASSYDGGPGTTLVVSRERDLFVADVANGRFDRLPVDEVEVARLDPSGKRIAFVRSQAVFLIDADGSDPRVLLEEAGVTWGRPEFAAWMSIGRSDGLWWSPDGRQLLVARVDETQVETRYLADPTNPTAEPRTIHIPAAGTTNADVRLFVVDLAGSRREVEWDRSRFEYIVRCLWTGQQPLIVVQTRDQRRLRILAVDPGSGRTTLVREVTDPEFVTVPERTPAQADDGRLVWIERDQSCDTYRLIIGDEVVTPPGLQVAGLRSVCGQIVTFLGQTDPTEVHVYVWDGDVRRLTADPGVHSGLMVDGTTLIDSRTVAGRAISVNGDPLPSREEVPVLQPRMEIVSTGPRELRTAVFRPTWHVPGSSRLPVLLTPYSGPGVQLVQKYRATYHLISQWFAEHGFIVLSTDGRGTPGRGPAFDRATVGDILEPVLDDQVDALRAVAEQYGDLDLDRVAIRGWSYGGYLAIGAVLHRPDVFQAAIGGAAVTDQRWYDSYWKERFLGHPHEQAAAYRRTSLLPFAGNLERPLLMIQGLADTNVWAGHALRFSGALNTLGKAHELVLLPGEGHAIGHGQTIEALLRRELAFLRTALYC